MSEKMLRDILSIEALHFDTWHKLGRILAEQGRFFEANECFKTANSLDISTPLIPFSVIPRLLKSSV
ncbi:TPR Domain containing protein [Aphelenchoides avenae]|nr:TPR Domain containing protein [Aphelenchus avenae]